MIDVEEKSLRTKKEFDIIDITEKVRSYVNKKKVSEGQVTVTTKHTTTAIRVNENEQRLLRDFKKHFNTLVSRDDFFLHDDIEKRKNCPKDEPKNAHAHLKALLMGASETLPILNGKLSLGKWQRIFFVEIDGPRNRDYTLVLVGNKKDN